MFQNNYKVEDWYWRASDGRIFSSARGQLVSETDADYVAWQRAPGHFATMWPRDDQGGETTAALQAVVGSAGVWCDVAAYASWKQQLTAQGGFTVNANAGGSPLLVSVDTSTQYVGYLQGAVSLAQMRLAANDATPIDWVQDSGLLSLSPQQVMTMGVAVATLLQQTFTTLGAAKAGVAAGTITTTAQVDALSWPINS